MLEIICEAEGHLRSIGPFKELARGIGRASLSVVGNEDNGRRRKKECGMDEARGKEESKYRDARSSSKYVSKTSINTKQTIITDH